MYSIVKNCIPRIQFNVDELHGVVKVFNDANKATKTNILLHLFLLGWKLLPVTEKESTGKNYTKI